MSGLDEAEKKLEGGGERRRGSSNFAQGRRSGPTKLCDEAYPTKCAIKRGDEVSGRHATLYRFLRLNTLSFTLRPSTSSILSSSANAQGEGIVEC